MARPKRPGYKFSVGQLVRFRGKKAQVLDRLWDGLEYNRYEVKFVIGKNLVGLSWSAIEQDLAEYESKQETV